MTQEIDLVRTKMHEEFTKKKQPPIYEPDMFQRFCVIAGATKLFDTILNSITSKRHSSERNALNKKRVVAFIYKMCYCLSQTCNAFQIDHALYLRGSHINQEAIETEHILGHACSRRTVNHIVSTMAESHYSKFNQFVAQAIENKWLLVLIVDDYTSIHTKRRPQDDKLSNAKTMCTIVVKDYPSIPVIKAPPAKLIHDINGITIKSCEHLITSALSMDLLSNSYCMPQSCPSGFKTQAFF